MNIRPIQKEQEARRLRAIEAIQQGFSQTHVAAMLGITSASVSNWKLRFRSGGVQELLAKPRGRPAGGQLSGTQAAALQRVMLRRCPDEAGLEARLWTWRAVQAQIFRSCNTEISRWTVLRYLNAWGFRPPNPMRRLRTQDLAARTRAIKLNARQNGDAFFFLERTSVAAAGGSESDAILWALGARADAAFMAAPESRLPERMSEFLDRVVDHAGGRSCVIVIGETLRRDIGMSKLTGGRNARIRIESLDVTESGIFDRAAVFAANCRPRLSDRPKKEDRHG